MGDRTLGDSGYVSASRGTPGHDATSDIGHRTSDTTSKIKYEYCTVQLKRKQMLQFLGWFLDLHLSAPQVTVRTCTVRHNIGQYLQYLYKEHHSLRWRKTLLYYSVCMYPFLLFSMVHVTNDMLLCFVFCADVRIVFRNGTQHCSSNHLLLVVSANLETPKKYMPYGSSPVKHGFDKLSASCAPNSRFNPKQPKT